MNNIFLRKQDKSLLQMLRQNSKKNLTKFSFSLVVVLLLINPFMGSCKYNEAEKKNGKWNLVWEDQFDGDKLDTNKWSLINTKPAQYDNASDWNKHMIADSAVFVVKDGNLYLKGINNTSHLDDPRPFLTGGVKSQGKFSFLYGKIEIRAKKECAEGAWPALWMMPEESVYGGWPHSGEIDIMEHLNFDDNIHHTVHTRYTNVLGNKTNPPRGTGDIIADVTEWNIYGLEWYPNMLIWTVNGKETFRYPKVEGSDPEMKQWPYDQPFYFILSQQLGGSWVGEVNPQQLPVSFIIDFVKVYQKL